MSETKTVSADEARELVRQFDESPPTELPWCVVPFGDRDGEPMQWWVESPGAACECVTKVDNEDGAENDLRFIARAANTHLDLAHTVIALHEELASLRAVVDAARAERAARLAWLSSLPEGSCTNPPTAELLAAEALTGELLDKLGAQKVGDR